MIKEISQNCIPEWPANVLLKTEGIYDQVRDEMFPLNHTGQQIVSCVNEDYSLLEIANIVSTRYAITLDEAIHDVNRFFLKLNQLLLVNFHCKKIRPFLLCRNLAWLFFMATMGNGTLVQNTLKNSFHYHCAVVNVCSPKALFHLCSLILTRLKILWLFFGFAIISLLTLILITYTPHNIGILLTYGGLAIVALMGLVVGVAIHELAHGLLWSRFSSQSQIIIAIKWNSIHVACSERPANEELLIAMAGPLANIIGAGVVGSALLFTSEGVWQMMISLLALSIGLCSLSLFSMDGYKILQSALKLIRFRVE